MGRVSQRERKVIHAVECPECGQPVGQPCRALTAVDAATWAGRPMVHGARRAAWQEWRRTHPVDVYARGGAGEGGTLVPQAEGARAAVLALVRGAQESGGSILVPDLREAIDRLTRNGWRVE